MVTSFCCVAASAQGPGHERNQDALLTWPLDHGGWLVAVADGHGSPRSFRSHIGSALAVQIAAELWSALPEGEAPHDAKRWVEASLPARLVAGWQRAAREHAALHPLSDDERRRFEAAFRSPPPPCELPLEVYGTTLLTAIARPAYLAFAQIGDGELLVLDDGGDVARPIAPDERLLANQTTSLASAGAQGEVRTAFQALRDRPPALVLLTTDGYPNSFAEPAGFEQAARDLLERLREHGASWLSERLPRWLAATSERGSGDDVTVALLVPA